MWSWESNRGKVATLADVLCVIQAPLASRKVRCLPFMPSTLLAPLVRLCASALARCPTLHAMSFFLCNPPPLCMHPTPCTSLAFGHSCMDSTPCTPPASRHSCSQVCRNILGANITSCGFNKQSVVHTGKAEQFLQRARQYPSFAGRVHVHVGIPSPKPLTNTSYNPPGMAEPFLQTRLSHVAVHGSLVESSAGIITDKSLLLFMLGLSYSKLPEASYTIKLELPFQTQNPSI